MKKKPLLLLSLAAFPLLAQEVPSYHISFDESPDAVSGTERIQPKEKNAYQPVAGIRGRGAHLDNIATLTYDAKKLMPHGNGTISVWFQIDWEPYGTGTLKDRDVLKNGDWGLGYGSDQAHHLLSIRGKRGLSIPLEQDTIGEKLAGATRRMMRGDWNHLTIVFHSGRRPRYFYNGTRNNFWFHKPEKHIVAPRTLVFGGKVRIMDNVSSGLLGAVDEFEVFDKPFSVEEVRAHHASFMPLEEDLLDFAGIVGKSKRLRMNVHNISGKKQNEKQRIVILSPSGKEIYAAEFPVELNAGEKKRLTIDFSPKEAGIHKLIWNAGTPRRRTREIYALENQTIASAMPADAPIKRRLLAEIDCTKKLPADRYLENASTRIVDGKYRECLSTDPATGFAYRISGIQNPGNPHWLEMEYPDDQSRAFFAGVYNFVWNRCHTLTLNNMGIVTGEDRPATGKMLTKKMLFWPEGKEVAVSVQQYMAYPGMKGLAVSKIRLYEHEGELPRLPEARNRREIGVWQEDPQFTANNWFFNATEARKADLEFWREKISRMIRYQHFMGINEWTIQVLAYGGDKTGLYQTLNNESTTGGYCPGWDSLWVAMLEREGLPFYVRLNQREFSPRFEHGSAIGWIIGEEHFAKDWEDYRKRGKDAIELLPFSAEKNISSLQKLRYVNPIHPKVIAANKKILSTYLEKYGNSPSFRGIHLNDCIEVGFHGMEYGYDDYTVSEFEKDTGIHVPAENRHAFLTAPERLERWKQWRCDRITRVLAEYASLFGKHQMVYQIQGNRYKELFEGNTKKTPEEALREFSIDTAAIAKLRNVKILQGIRPMFSFVERQNSSEDYFLLSDSFGTMFGPGKITGLNVVYIANMEVWMNNRKDIPIERWFPAGLQRGDRAHMNTYATALPTNEWVLEPYTHALAAYDCGTLYHGFWGNTENGATEEFREFFRAMRAIPEGKYQLAPGTNDPVAIRISGHHYYLVNRTHQPLELNCKLNGVSKTFHMKPNSLISGTAEADAVFTDIRPILPESYLQSLEKRLRYLKKNQDTGTAVTIAQMEKCFREGRYFRLETFFRIAKIRNLMKKPPVGITWNYDWKKEIFSIRIENSTDRKLQGKASLTKLPKGWACDKPESSFTVDANGQIRADIPVNASSFTAAPVNISANVEIDGKLYQYPQILIRGIYANRGADKTKQFWTVMNSRYYMSNRRIASRLTEKFEPRVAWYWTENGIGLYVDVPKKEFFAPKKAGNLFLADSLQIYFDQKNNAQRNASFYDRDDLVFQAGLLNGKAVVWCEQGPQKGNVDTPVEIKVHEGRVFYHVFFKKELLPEFKIENGACIGAGLLINAFFQDKDGKFNAAYAYNQTNPYQHPGAWMDLYLGEETPAGVLLRVTGKALIPEKIPDGQGWVSVRKDSLQFTGPFMTGKKRKYSMRFTPQADGMISLTVSGQYNRPAMQKENYVKIFKIEASGAELQDGMLETVRSGSGNIWKLHPRNKGLIGKDGITVNFWNGITQKNIAVKKNVPVTISVEASLGQMESK